MKKKLYLYIMLFFFLSIYLLPENKAFAVREFICSKAFPFIKIKEQMLSIKKEDIDKSISEETLLELNYNTENQKPLKESEEFKIYKYAITELRKKIFNELNNSEYVQEQKTESNKKESQKNFKTAANMNQIEREIFKNQILPQDIKTDESNNKKRIRTNPKTFSYGDLKITGSNEKNYELFSLSGQYQMQNTIEGNKIFVNYKEPISQKLIYFNPPKQELVLKMQKSASELLKKSQDSLNESIKLLDLEKTINDPKKKKMIYQRSLNLKDDSINLKKQYEDLKYVSESNLARKEYERIHNDRVVSDFSIFSEIKDSDSEVLILEKVLDLTEPDNNTQAKNIEEANKHEIAIANNHSTQYTPIEILNLRLNKHLNVKDLNQNIYGNLKIYTSYETCLSCQNAFILFSLLRPNIKLEITVVSNEIRNYIYRTNFDL